VFVDVIDDLLEPSFNYLSASMPLESNSFATRLRIVKTRRPISEVENAKL
jgi:hypothetical protein